MATDLVLILTFVAPLLTVGVTVGLWLTLMILQSPRPYWRDSLNVSIAGVFLTLSTYLLTEALTMIFGVSYGWFDAQLLTIIAGLFSLVGLPRTLHELQRAIARKRAQG